MRYRALTGLTIPQDDEEDERLRVAIEAGNPIPWEERRLVRVEAEEVVDWLPARSLPWLVRQNLIERIPETEADLDELKRAELEAAAEAQGVDISGAKTKAEIVERIEERG